MVRERLIVKCKTSLSRSLASDKEGENNKGEKPMKKWRRRKSEF